MVLVAPSGSLHGALSTIFEIHFVNSVQNLSPALVPVVRVFESNMLAKGVFGGVRFHTVSIHALVDFIRLGLEDLTSQVLALPGQNGFFCFLSFPL